LPMSCGTLPNHKAAEACFGNKSYHCVKPYMFGHLSTSSVLLIFFVISSLSAQDQGPKAVPMPAGPPAKRGPSPRKDRSALPVVPTFVDIARKVGLAVSHIAAPEAHYVIDSTSGGVGLFDCDNDDRLDAVLVNGSTVERLRQGGDPMVTLYHQEP